MSKAENTHALSIANRRLKAPPIALVERVLRRYCHFDIQSVYGLIKAFGGFEPVASDYGCTAEAIERWAIHGSIPTGWQMRCSGEFALWRNRLRQPSSVSVKTATRLAH
jgi:hypothetical protein